VTQKQINSYAYCYPGYSSEESHMRPINAKAPDVIRRLESSTEIAAWKSQGTKPRQICILDIYPIK
jgi:hypothetical protein